MASWKVFPDGVTWGIVDGDGTLLGHTEEYDTGIAIVKMRRLLESLVEDDPFLPDYSRRRDGATACYFCGGEDGAHVQACIFIEAKALVGK